MVGLFSWLAGLVNRGKYVASRNSTERLYHKVGCRCHYLESIEAYNAIYFKTKAKAEAKGLRMCRICNHRVYQKKLKEYT